MEKDEKHLIKLRDCFTAGYTFPQYCIDNGIKKPLFVTEGKFLTFAWEVYVQFCYDKRMMAKFSVLDLPTDKINLTARAVTTALSYKNFSEINPEEFDAIILLTLHSVKVTNKLIPLDKLLKGFVSKAYAEIPILNFLQRHPGVKVFCTILPNRLSYYKDGVEFAQSLTPRHVVEKSIRESGGVAVPTPLDRFGYTNEEVVEMSKLKRRVKVNLDGTTSVEDNNHPLIRIVNGKRLTAYQPENYRNKIYFLGPCHYIGTYAPYDKTIESYLQKMLNEHNFPYRVENEGQHYWGRYQDVFYNMEKLNPVPGDIIFIYINNLISPNLPALNLRDAFDPPLNYKEFFYDNGHFNELGYKVLAERFFNILTENNFFRDVEFNYHMPPPHVSQIRYTATIRAGRRKIFRQRGAGSLQKNFAHEKNSNRRVGHELQSVHARSSISRRIRGG
ncbi:MAG: hypothetical protein IKN16_01155 [Selenomonadaceae bacterium]|nr:hypothetical protein [Selenomonadaceae bacterium]